VTQPRIPRELLVWLMTALSGAAMAYWLGVRAAYNFWAAGGPPTAAAQEFASRATVFSILTIASLVLTALGIYKTIRCALRITDHDPPGVSIGLDLIYCMPAGRLVIHDRAVTLYRPGSGEEKIGSGLRGQIVPQDDGGSSTSLRGRDVADQRSDVRHCGWRLLGV
jgi:hypothetical protein